MTKVVKVVERNREHWIGNGEIKMCIWPDLELCTGSGNSGVLSESSGPNTASPCCIDRGEHGSRSGPVVR